MENNILKLAAERGSAVVTRSGKQVRIYNSEALDAEGRPRIHGVVLGQTPEGKEATFLCSWYADGKLNQGLESTFDLVVYEISTHFEWEALPSWANYCIFRTETGWKCSSVLPTRGPHNWMVPQQGVCISIPESFTEGILWQGSDRDSLTINPKYNEQ